MIYLGVFKSFSKCFLFYTNEDFTRKILIPKVWRILKKRKWWKYVPKTNSLRSSPWFHQKGALVRPYWESAKNLDGFT